MSEKTLRKNMIAALKEARMHPVAVENPCHPGTPDVNYVGGWVELKQLDAWPANPSTGVSIPHLTRQQVLWLGDRCVAGGNAYLLLQVGKEYLLFHGCSVKSINGSTRLSLKRMALAVWDSLADMKSELPGCLQK